MEVYLRRIVPLMLVACVAASPPALVVGVVSDEMGVVNALTSANPELAASLHPVKLPAADHSNAYDRLLRVDEQLRKFEVQAVVGQYDPVVAMATEREGLPYLVTSLLGNVTTKHVFHVLPYPEDISRAFVDVINAYKWSRIAVIFEQGFGSPFVDRLISPCQTLDCNFWKLSTSYQAEELRTALIAVRQRDIQHIVCVTTASHTADILRQARRLGMASAPHTWLLLDLDLEEAAGDILMDLKANITALKLVKTPLPWPTGRPADRIKVAAMADALQALVMVSNTSVHRGQLTHSLKMNKVLFMGKTGDVRFSHEGRRTYVVFDIYNFGVAEFRLVGSWRADHEVQEHSLSLTAPEPVLSISSLYPLLGKSVRVVTILEKPFAMLRHDHASLQGNARFEGFAVDMMEEISSMLGFTYHLYVVPDGNFGIKMPNGEWNGMIGEVLNGNASMTMAPLSINAMREDAIDFTKPFKTRGITVLMKTPAQQSSFFQFLKPLSMQVWFCTLLAIIVISLVLVGLEHMCVICRSDMPKLNLKEGFWFIIGSVVSGSTESTPVTVPGRILTSAWWFFALILVSTYTANLAAFLTVKKIHPPISDVTDLAEQSKIKFGTVRNSGVMTFFKNTEIQPFAKMWTQMNELIPDSMVNTTVEGFQRIKEGDYAFLWDSSVTSYYANVDCDFTEIGPPFDPKGFGMGTPPGAPYTEALSLAILRLGDSGKIVALEDKYWGQGECPDLSKPSTDETAELQLENVAGIFFVLLGGVCVALLGAGVDRVLQWRRSFNPDKTEKKTEIMDMQPKTGATNAMRGFI